LGKIHLAEKVKKYPLLGFFSVREKMGFGHVQKRGKRI